MTATMGKRTIFTGGSERQDDFASHIYWARITYSQFGLGGLSREPPWGWQGCLYTKCDLTGGAQTFNALPSLLSRMSMLCQSIPGHPIL
ncbi:hypothetical protein A1O3_03282 [Capronia epimyces CBS 606.96]|uniref:Uncharacterized protein n=1 Tax=Capronia epimyces CBS 606.96 TaxID=1182542 RepID=W9YAR2_9EURO|nr:uncharacterized protein A1O3_03282 [Capronia epimyces CBS 606.96]EXJ86331.1 hypothetical protein A1O3_03282 [Capronia epimyces CBS 606.96]